MSKKIIAYLLWLTLGPFVGAHRIYLKKDLWWLYPLLWLLTYFGLWLGPGAITFLILVGFWLYDGWKINQWLSSEKNG